MMKPVVRVDGANASATDGAPEIDPAKALWNGGMLLATLLFGLPLLNWGSAVLFVTTTYVTLLVGHSVGMHRMMIHRSFSCSKPMERSLIYIGVLVGVAGPFGIIRIHDTRDWAQRQPACHDFFAHRRRFLIDLPWQLGWRFAFALPPRITIESRFTDDRFYRFLDRSWRWQQLPVAVLFYLVGGWSWVIWGICARVFVSAAGHWSITYWCHNPGPGNWHVRGAAVQAANRPGLGLLTYGECWHNNHHAFPESARIGIAPGQLDPGWWLIHWLERVGMARDVGQPRPVASREDLIAVER